MPAKNRKRTRKHCNNASLPSTKKRRLRSNLNHQSKRKQNHDEQVPKQYNYTTRTSSTINVKSTDTVNLLDDDDEDEDIDIIKPISKKWKFKSQHGHKQKLITMDNAAIDTLKKGKEVNNDIIEFGLYYIYNSWNEDFKQQCYLLPTQFWIYLKEYKNGLVESQKCYRKIGNDIIKKKYIIFPKGTHGHWELVIICNPNIYQSNHNYNAPCIIILDSMNKGTLFHVDDFKKIRVWLNYMVNTNKYDSIKCKGYCPEVTAQKNGSDCGVFLVKNMQKFGEDQGFHDTTSEIALNRKYWYTVEDGEYSRYELVNIIDKL